MMRKIKLLLVPATILAAGPVLLQTPSQQTPTFRARTRLIQVDVIVRDKNGPVMGLTQDDFTVLDNGKPQKIAVFAVKGSQSSQRSAVPLPAGTVSNRVNRNGQEAASSTVLLIDQTNPPPDYQHYSNEKIVKFLETRRNQDRIGIYTLGEGLRVIQDLTDDPERLSRAVNGLKPHDSKHRILDVPGDFEKREVEMSTEGHALSEYQAITLGEHVTNVQQALQAIARHLASVPGRKSLIWVTGGFPLIVKHDHYNEDYTPEMKAAARALNNANVALYAVDARGLVAGYSKLGGLTAPNLDTMNDLAGHTGGRAFYGSNGIDSSIQAAVEDSELLYTLAFYPSQESQDGDWHDLKVVVDRKGVTTRYRENYFASNVLADADHRPTLDQLLHETVDAAEIGLRAETSPDPKRPGFFRVRSIVDLHDVHLEHQDAGWVGAVHLSLYVQGSPSASRITRKLEIPEDQLASSLEEGAVIDYTVELTGQAGELRVVVQDAATGAGGSVRVPLKRN
jgi:VWFA-related protein